jgi:predicted nucleic acid-binding protein
MPVLRETVVDASVAVKWVLREPGRSEALEWLDDYQEGRIALIAPELLLVEAGNVLSKHYRRKKLTSRQARAGFQFVDEYAPTLMPLGPLVPPAMELSLAHQIPLYDCLYLALAIERGCDLITADRRLFSATAQAYPLVQLLDERV